MKNFIKGMFMVILFSLMLIPAAIAACVDSDGGVVRDVAGSVDQDGTVYNDYCSVLQSGEAAINEYYCDWQNQPASTQFNCAAYGYNSCQAGACVNIADPLAISNVASSPGDISASITWDSNRIADSTVFYGLTIDLGSTENRIQNVVGHSVQLNGLTPQTTYYYKVKSCYEAECVESSILNFNTIATDITAPIINSVNANPNPVMLSNNINLDASVTDDGVIDSVWVEIGGINGTLSASLVDGVYRVVRDTNNLGLGSFEYTFYARDTFGNQATPVLGIFDVVELVDTPTRAIEKTSTLWVTDSIAHYLDGDAYINENIYDPNWVWDLTRVNNYKFGIENDFIMDNSDDNPPSVGGYISLPDDFIRIYFNELVEPGYVQYTFKVANLDLTNFGGGATDGVISIKTNIAGELRLLASNLNGISEDVNTNEIYIKNIDINTDEFYYKDVSNGLQFAGDMLIGGTPFVKANSNTEFRISLVDYNDYGKLVLGYNDGSGDRQDVFFYKDVNEDYVSLGVIANTAESNEIKYLEYSEGSGNWWELGSKNLDLRTAYGVVIKNPAENSLSDQVILEIPNSHIQANLIITDQDTAIGGVSGNLKVVSDDIYEIFGSSIDANDVGSLQSGKISHDGNIYDIYDELYFYGLNVLSIQTGLTSQDDSYGTNVYMEVKAKDTINYYYHFNLSFDSNQITESIPIGIYFLNNKLIVTSLVDDISIDLGVAEETSLKEGESTILYGKSVLVNTINPDNSINFDVNENPGAVNEDRMALVDGLYVFNYDVIRGDKSIADQTWNEDASNNNAFDLDDYFIGEGLEYSVSGNDQIIVSIDENNVVSFSQPADWFGNEIVTFTATNAAGSVDSNSIVLTVNDVAESSNDNGNSGGGSGGGGGGGAATISPRSEKAWSAIGKGESAVMKVLNPEIGLMELNINVENPVKNVKIIVEKLAGKPAEVSKEVSGRAYQYLSIDKKNIENSDISDAIIKFKIENINIRNNEEAVLYRYGGDKWEDLDTRLVGQDVIYNYYEATTPGFSYFAIAIKPKVVEIVETLSLKDETVEIETETQSKEDIETNGNLITGGAISNLDRIKNSTPSLIILISLISVVFVGLGYYIFYKRKKV